MTIIQEFGEHDYQTDIYKSFHAIVSTKCRLTTSDELLHSIQEKIKWADTVSELDKKHKKEVEDRVEEVKKSLTIKVSESTLIFYTS